MTKPQQKYTDAIWHYSLPEVNKILIKGEQAHIAIHEQLWQNTGLQEVFGAYFKFSFDSFSTHEHTHLHLIVCLNYSRELLGIGKTLVDCIELTYCKSKQIK